MKRAMHWLLLMLFWMGNPSHAGLADPLFVWKTGEVSLTYLGYEASYTNTLWVHSPFFLGPLFENKTTPIGSTFSLGVLPAGTPLTFAIVVHNTGYTFLSGAADANPDLSAHAMMAPMGSGLVNVGFEDLLHGGDRDYNDLRFSVANVTIHAAPEPSVAVLALVALGLFSVVAKRRRAQPLDRRSRGSGSGFN